MLLNHKLTAAKIQKKYHRMMFHNYFLQILDVKIAIIWRKAQFKVLFYPLF